MNDPKNHRRFVLVTLILYLVVLIGSFSSFSREDFPAPTRESMTNGVWPQQFERYLQEHLGFHDLLFRVKSRTDLFVGEKMVQGVYVTDDRLLEKLLAEDIPDAEEAAAPINEFYERAGIPTFLLLVPSASEIYDSTLPANAVNAEQSGRIQQIYAATENGIRCIDGYHILSPLKDSYIYYRTDTHWTSLGAYYVYQSAIQKMGFTPVPYQRYVIEHKSTEFRGDLYLRTLYDGVKPDVLDWYRNESGQHIESVTAYYADGSSEARAARLYEEAYLDTEDMYRFYLGKPCEKLIIRTDLESDKTLLLIKDDFADCMIPFLAEHYSEICVIDLSQAGRAYLSGIDPTAYTQAFFVCSMGNWEMIWK